MAKKKTTERELKAVLSLIEKIEKIDSEITDLNLSEELRGILWRSEYEKSFGDITQDLKLRLNIKLRNLQRR